MVKDPGEELLPKTMLQLIQALLSAIDNERRTCCQIPLKCQSSSLARVEVDPRAQCHSGAISCKKEIVTVIYRAVFRSNNINSDLQVFQPVMLGTY